MSCKSDALQQAGRSQLVAPAMCCLPSSAHVKPAWVMVAAAYPQTACLYLASCNVQHQHDASSCKYVVSQSLQLLTSMHPLVLGLLCSVLLPGGWATLQSAMAMCS